MEDKFDSSEFMELLTKMVDQRLTQFKSEFEEKIKQIKQESIEQSNKSLSVPKFVVSVVADESILSEQTKKLFTIELFQLFKKYHLIELTATIE